MMKDGLEVKNEKILSFLMIGQSNMAGRGDFGEVPVISNKDCYMLRMGRWQVMSEPINPDRDVLTSKFHSGVCLAASFADEVSKYTGRKVGLIPCADGGTKISQWQPGEILFDHAVMMAKLAMRTSEFGGIIWHQGESDCDEKNEPLYKERLTTIINALRDKLGLHDVPFIIGGLGDFLLDFSPHYAVHSKIVNGILESMADDEKLIGFVPATGLGGNPDNMHFSAPALREFGLRYYDEFRRLENKDKVFEDRNTFDSGIVNVLEVL